VKRFFLLSLLVVPLVVALISEYVFGLVPCVLCLLQRWPYYAGTFIIGMGLLTKTPSSYLALIAFMACIFAGLISTFHMGVEYEWWEGTAKCGGQPLPDTIEEIRAHLWAAPTTKCSDPAFVFMGLSMAGWGVVYAIIAAITSLILYIKRHATG